MLWYFHHFENFPQFVMIHTVKGFGVVNKAGVDVFLELSCFLDDPADMTEQLHFHFHFHALEKEMATHSSVLAWRIPGTGEPGGLPSTGLHRVGHD